MQEVADLENQRIFVLVEAPVGIGDLPEQADDAGLLSFVEVVVEQLREILLFGRYSFGLSDLVAPLITLLILFLGLRFFRRVSPHFEDFL